MNMWPFDDDEDQPKADLSQPYTGSPEQKALIAKSLKDRYAQASDRSDVDSAQQRERNGNIFAAAMKGLGDYVTANSASRGGPGMDQNVIGTVGKIGAQGVANADAARKDRMNDVLKQDEIDRLGTDRAFQDKERGQKEKEFKLQDAYNDPNSTQSKAIRTQYAKLFPDISQAEGFDQLSANDIKAGLSDPLKLRESIEARKEAAKQRSADRAAMLGARAQDKADAAAKKEGEYESQVKIPGLDVMPGYRPTKEMASKVRESKTAHDDLTGALDSLDDLYSKSGTNMVGEDASRQEAIVNSMRTRLKDLERLGALSAGDYALLDAQLPDPNSWTENLKGMVGQDRYKAKSQEFRKALERSLQSAAKNNGYSVTAPAHKDDDVEQALKKTPLGVHGKDLP